MHEEYFRVLGTYKPSRYDALAIGEDLVRYTHNEGLLPIERREHPFKKWERHALGEASSLYFAADVRGPEWHTQEPDDTVENWHQDGHLQDYKGKNLPMSLVLWSSETPTEFLMPDGEIIVPEPFEIVLVDNLKVQHRMPEVLGTNRWFFRQAVMPPKGE